ncbi:hypothetical protein B0H17DRAFT_1297339 [Mycena rosella]|uniref:Uncharacterized protein n=1 Tax=Mycena rosella TaxID=1033263 RepID=A0AAD7DD84_MYCRO|nr:hypothetical protein B0H17DRAFT_1297339 [Mycena rosella]
MRGTHEPPAHAAHAAHAAPVVHAATPSSSSSCYAVSPFARSAGYDLGQQSSACVWPNKAGGTHSGAPTPYERLRRSWASSSIERNRARREQAAFLRQSARVTLERVARGVWLEATLAEAALILAQYESSAHPEYRPDHLVRALAFLEASSSSPCSVMSCDASSSSALWMRRRTRDRHGAYSTPPCVPRGCRSRASCEEKGVWFDGVDWREQRRHARAEATVEGEREGGEERGGRQETSREGCGVSSEGRLHMSDTSPVLS